jgi:hypothetical protein
MRGLVVVAALALVGCIPPPKQTGGLGFFDHAGLKRRMAILCRLGVGDDHIRAACEAPKGRHGVVADAPPPKPVRRAKPAKSANSANSVSLASKSCSKCDGVGTLAPAARLTR